VISNAVISTPEGLSTNVRPPSVAKKNVDADAAALGNSRVPSP